MVVRDRLPTAVPWSLLVLLFEVCSVLAQNPSPSPKPNQTAGGGVSVSAIPGLGSLTKHKWWVWLLVALGGAFVIVIAAFVIRGVLRYRRAK
ncbi:hypothetical protein WJX84_004154 [Apatococcus fuscideae]